MLLPASASGAQLTLWRHGVGGANPQGGGKYSQRDDVEGDAKKKSGRGFKKRTVLSSAMIKLWAPGRASGNFPLGLGHNHMASELSTNADMWQPCEHIEV